MGIKAAIQGNRENVAQFLLDIDVPMTVEGVVFSMVFSIDSWYAVLKQIQVAQAPTPILQLYFSRLLCREIVQM